MSVTRGPEHVEGRAVADLSLQLHVVFDLVEGDMARPLDHDLNAVAPSPFGEFTERGKLAQLRIIGGIRESAWAKPISD